ncbi:hypothetical protein GCM10009692_31950 [Leucobacter aridicollis]
MAAFAALSELGLRGEWRGHEAANDNGGSEQHRERCSEPRPSLRLRATTLPRHLSPTPKAVASLTTLSVLVARLRFKDFSE